MVLIKKYGNRRLYDTGDSRYITLDELAARVRNGADVRVVDAQTNEDLTQATLVQIVLETGNAAKFLPVQLLTQMIRLSDDALARMWMGGPFAAPYQPPPYSGYAAPPPVAPAPESEPEPAPEGRSD